MVNKFDPKKKIIMVNKYIGTACCLIHIGVTKSGGHPL